MLFVLLNDSGSGSKGTESPPRTTSTSAAAPSAQQVADRQTGRVGLISLDDVPAGWRSDSGTGAEGLPSTSACRGILKMRERAKKTAATVESPQFSSDALSMGSSIAVFPTDADAQAAYAVYAANPTQVCWADQAKRAVGATAKKQGRSPTLSVQAGQVAGSAFGDATVHYQFDVKAGGQPAGRVDIYAVRSGRSVAIYDVTRRAFVVGSQEDRQIISLAVGRLRAALAGLPIPDLRDGLPLGTPLVGPQGQQVTAFQYQVDIPSQIRADQAGLSPPGWVWAAADVEMCASTGPGDLSVSTADFTVVFPDNTQSKYGFAVPGAQFPAFTSLRDGACTRGWVPFAVPGPVPGAKLQYQNSFTPGRPLTWTLG